MLGPTEQGYADFSADRPGHFGEVIDLDGRFVIPGLWDEHVHFTQLSLISHRLDVGGAASAAEAADMVRERARNGGMPPAGPLVGHGFRDGLWPDMPSSELLDQAAFGAPVVLISADLHTAWLNTTAAETIGVAIDEYGLVREDDAFLVERAVNELPDVIVDVWAAEAAQQAASRGVVGIVDLEMAWNLEVWARRRASGDDSLRVQFGIYSQFLDTAIELGIRTGQKVDELTTVGFLKILIDGSLNTRTAYCLEPYADLEGDDRYGLLTVPEDELDALLRTAAMARIVPTIHAIGDAANKVALDAFARTATTGRIEHAQLIAVDDFARFAQLGVTASVQPEHAMDDREVADHFWADRADRAFAWKSLLDAGATLAFGSDAPVSALDPWLGMAAAIGRTADEREPWHPEQSITPEQALYASTRGRGVVSEGEIADIAITEYDPLNTPAEQLRAMPVAATLLEGRFTHRAL
ncbi:amidohydrolase [Naasia lichenicola]|uniref:Amidohydrolase n=2 Tax=Naasia lichenicola TaxID=2565933 RepID=A0A4S4FFB9_9MICO|nr:amidohydrolase [Naasia lichenicola]